MSRGNVSTFLQQRFERWVAKRIPVQHSVTLNQRRIFIVPTWQGLALIVVALLLLLMSINFESPLNIALAFLLLAMLWASVHMTYRNLSGLTLSAHASSLVEVGEEGDITLLLASSRQRVRGTIELIHASWGLVSVNVDGVQASVKVPVAAVQRGPNALPRFRVESRFPFGMVVAWSYVQLDSSIWAYPQPQPWDRRGLSSHVDDDQDMLDDHFLHAGSEDFHQLREYNAGDSVHRLHWPSFSKDQLVVKTFADYQAHDQWVDWTQFVGAHTEQWLAAIAYTAQHYNLQQNAYGVRLPNQDIEPGQGLDHLRRVRQCLAEYGYV